MTYRHVGVLSVGILVTDINQGLDSKMTNGTLENTQSKKWNL
jgi:hypothetical protein